MSSRTKIENIFSESVYDEFKTRKYGITSCKDLICPHCAHMLRELYISRKERYDCEQDPETCNYKEVKELINTL